MVAPRVGIFVDADNLLPFWKTHVSGLKQPGEYLQAADYAQFLTEIDDQAAAEGTVEVREAYGKWDNKARYIAATLMYHEYGYELQHVPPLSRFSPEGADPFNLKNAGDILLSSRAILAAATGSAGLDTIIIAAADNDYQPLVVELKRLGKRVLCLSFPLKGQQRDLLAKVFDGHLVLHTIPRWTALEKEQQHPGLPALAPRPVEPVEPPKMLDPEDLAALLWPLLEKGPALTKELRTRLEGHGHVDISLTNPFVQRLGVDVCLLVEGLRCSVPADAVRGDWVTRASQSMMIVLVKTALRDAQAAHPDVANRFDAVRQAILGAISHPTANFASRLEVALARGSA